MSASYTEIHDIIPILARWTDPGIEKAGIAFTNL